MRIMKLIALLLLVLTTPLTKAERWSYSEKWSVFNDFGDCICLCDDYLYYATGISSGKESWGPEQFVITRVNLASGECIKIDYQPTGYLIALLPDEPFIFFVSIDHRSIESAIFENEYEHIYSLTVSMYDPQNERISRLFSEEKAGDQYAYNDFLIQGKRVYLLSSSRIDEIDICTGSISNLYYTEDAEITNKLYYNHSVIYKNLLFFSTNDGCIRMIDTIQLKTNLITKDYYEELPSDPMRVGHYGYYVFSDTLYYWNDKNQVMSSIDLNSMYECKISNNKVCLWYIGTESAYYSVWYENNRKIFLQHFDINRPNNIEGYLPGSIAFLTTYGYDGQSISTKHSSRW